MSISRWKMMACTLGLTVGGLVFMAGQSNNKLNAQWEIKDAKSRPQATSQAPVLPVTNKPVPAPTALETPPLIVVPVPQDFVIPTPIVVPTIRTASAIELELIPDAPMTGPESLPMPREAKAVAPAIDLFEQFNAPPPVTRVPPPPVEPAPVDIALPPAVAPRAPEVIAPNPPTIAVPMTPPQAAPIAPPVFVQPVPPPVAQFVPPPAPPMAPPPSKPLPPEPQVYQQVPVAQQAVPASKLKMLLRLGDGKPRFEIRTNDSTDLLFKVYGEKVEMQAAPDGVRNSPIAGVTATGKVRFVGAGIEGTCDSLSILSGTGEVLLKGNVHMKTKRGKAWSEMTAEKLIYQIGASGLTTPASKSPVTPAAYQEFR